MIGILISVVSLSSQSPDTLWTKTYGGLDIDVGGSVVETSDGRYIIGGWTYSFGAGGCDVYLVKTYSSGDSAWTRVYGGYLNDGCSSIRETPDGGYILVGLTYSFGAGGSDVYIIRTDSAGDSLWTRTYGGLGDDCGESIRLTYDGGYIIAGNRYSFVTGSSDVYLIKTDEDGDTLWTKTYGGKDNDRGFGVLQTPDSGYVIAGRTESFGTGAYDVYLIRTDPTGDTVWTRTYGGINNDYGYSLDQTSDSGFIVAGHTRSFGSGNWDIYLIKTDIDGNAIWEKTYGNLDIDEAFSVKETSDGGYIIAGASRVPGSSNDDVYLVKTRSNGDTLWTGRFGGSYDDWGYGVEETADGGYIVTGYTKSFGPGYCGVYIIKTEPDVGVEEVLERGKIREDKIDIRVSPNPFRKRIVISLAGVSDYPEAGVSKINIYDVSGRLVKSLSLSAEVSWNGKNSEGNEVKPGIYFLKVKGSKPVKIEKIK